MILYFKLLGKRKKLAFTREKANPISSTAGLLGLASKFGRLLELSDSLYNPQSEQHVLFIDQFALFAASAFFATLAIAFAAALSKHILWLMFMCLL